MLKKTKKILAVLLILTITCSLFPISAYAATSYKVKWLSKDYNYLEEFHNGYASVFHIIRIEGFHVIGAYGCIDKSGKLIVPLNYGEIKLDSIKDGVVKVINGPGYKYGYFDLTAGKEILPATYDITGDFNDGLAWVRKDESFMGPAKFGYIDRTGNFILPLEYESARDFNNGVAVVKKDKVWQLIDKTGQVVKALPYDDIGQFNEGIAAVSKDNKLGYINTMGNEIAPPIYELDRSVGSANSQFKNGMAVVQLNGESNVIDKTGKQLFPEFYDFIQYYDEDIFKVGVNYQYSSYDKDFKYGFIDIKGNQLAPNIYSQVLSTEFHDGLAIVRKGGPSPIMYTGLNNNGSKFGFVDQKGKEVIPAVYDDASDFAEGMARVKKNGKWYLIDKTGKLYSYAYDNVDYFEKDKYSFYNGLAVVSKNGKKGLINKSLKVVVPLIYDDIYTFGDGLYRVSKSVKNSQKWGYIDKNGKVVVPIVYDFLNQFSEGLASGKKNGKYGFVDKGGREVIPFIYQGVYDFNGGVATVKQNNIWGIVENPLKPASSK